MKIYMSFITCLIVLMLSACNLKDENQITGEVVGKNSGGSCIEVKVTEGIVKENELCLYLKKEAFNQFKVGQKIQAELAPIEATTVADRRVKEIKWINK